MTGTRRPVPAEAPASDRRGWLAQALAGAACTTLTGLAHADDAAAHVKSGAGSPELGNAPVSKPNLLASLLERNHGLRPDYHGGLSNHVSMALYSLTALGANADQLQRFAEPHWSRLEPLPSDPGPRVGPDDWRAQLGKREAINGYRALFAQAIARDGRDATLRKYLPGLLPGVGAAAFHPLIRVGYGVRFADDREIADGLAYWATAYLPLGALGRAGTEKDPRVLLASVHSTRSLAGRELGGHLITGKMKSAAELPEFAAMVDALAPSDATLAALAAASVRLYLVDSDFTALHAVTGSHAYRMIQPYVAPKELGLRFFWQALVAAYVSIGAPSLVDPPAGDVPDWSASLARARISLDEHDIKLVDIAHEQGAFYGDELFRRAAAQRLG